MAVTMFDFNGVKRLALLWLVVAELSLVSAHAISLSKDGYLDLRKQLRFLNRPGVKSFKTDYGDIFDCVDIYKQIAFDHPLLRNHTIKMKPSSFPKGIENEASSDIEGMVVQLKGGGCPQGTVPIRRTRIKDLLRAKSFFSFGKKDEQNGPLASGDGVRQQFARIGTQEGFFYGTEVRMNVWAPQVTSNNQHSRAQLWVFNGYFDEGNTVEAGWTVDPKLYGDKRARLFVYWTADGYQKTGCFNLLCPGFVQVSNEIPLGYVFNPVSTYNGFQFAVTLQVFMDQKTGDWWLKFGDKAVGYWPKSLFNYLGNASFVLWGGEAGIAGEGALPPMGSSRFPVEGFGKSSFMRMVKVIDGSNNLVDAPTNTSIYTYKPKCYDVDDKGNIGDDYWQRHFYFGGPGGNDCQIE